MKGAHDLGGRPGFGAVNPPGKEPVFHEEWEKRAFALTLAAGFLGQWNLDMSRFARETMDDDEYLATSYYEHWIHGLETLLAERNLLTAEEIQTRVDELKRRKGPNDESA